MSVSSFTPEVWSKEILVALQNVHVYAPLCNRDYEGDIANMGDTVRINGIGDITITTYTKDTDINPPQALTDAQTALVIDQAKYFNFAVDDVDALQQQPKVMGEALDRAAYGIGEGIDDFVAGLYVNAPSANMLGTSGSPITPAAAGGTDANIGTSVFDYLVKLGTIMTANKLPKSGRWVVVPPWVSEALFLDKRFTGYNTDIAAQIRAAVDVGGEDAGSKPGFIGMIRGMTVYESNNAPHLSGTANTSDSVDVVLASHPMCITFANQINKVEAYRPPTRFSDAVKGLSLYGAKVTRPYGLAVAVLQHP